MRIVLIGMLFGICAMAQNSTLRVFSEFTRIDPFGEVVPQDRGKFEPREFLSPGAPRNAFTSIRIVVTLDKPAAYTLDIGQNPENAVTATLYKEKFEKHGDTWIPDGLEPVKIPYEGAFKGDEVPGQKAITFWLDMWVDKNAPVDRIKVEPQLWVSTFADWFTYPMEVRVLSTVLPGLSNRSAGVLPAVTDRSDAAASGPLRERFCGVKEPAGSSQTENARSLIRRNVLQHLKVQDATLPAKLLKASGAATMQQWCSSKAGSANGPEWYLRLRDSVVQARPD